MKKNKLINLSIVLLALLAVIQTGSLWLGQTGSRNIFYSYFNNVFSSGKNSNESYRPIIAESCAVGIGSNRYAIFSVQNGKYWAEAENAISAALENGLTAKNSALDWNVFTDKNIVLKYPFSVSSAEFAKGFSGTNSIAIDNFDFIVVTPSYMDDKITVTFINSEDNSTSAITAADSAANKSLCNAIDETESSDLLYISSAQSGFNIFKSNVFLPQWTAEEYSYSPLRSVQAGTDENEILTTYAIKKMVQPFFEPYGLDGSSIDTNGVHLFYTEETVVKYYPNGVLEYFSYEKSNESQTLASAYDSCMKFIENDTSIGTDIYLSDAETTTEGIVFRFNYSCENVPIELSEELKERLGIESAIEVVVNNNIVKKYRKYAYNFYPNNEEVLFANTDFLSEINRVIMEYSSDGQAILVNDISLCYYADGNKGVSLKWITNLGGNTYAGETFVDTQEGDNNEFE